ncbi:MAG: hypothetical protein CSA96_03830 [Bacteroidetes bacterium]|nr:MAG: hypothetical protein CSA96_03830 [Bacteroidota bacterium]
MRLLHIEDRFHPEMGYQINYFARFHAPGTEVVILTSVSTRLWGQELNLQDLQELDRDFESKYKVKIHRLPAALDRRTKSNIWMKGLRRAIREIAPDIVFLHTLESYSALRLLSWGRLLYRYPFFSDTHTLLNQFNKSLAFRLHLFWIRKVVRRRLIRSQTRVFATVPENAAILRDHYGLPPEQILYSPIGTDLASFRRDERAGAALRKELAIPASETLVLYTGKLNARKNPHLLLDAMRPHSEELASPMHLCFVGEADSAYLKARFHEEAMGKNLHIHRYPAVPSNTLYRWYSMADFAVFPDENTLSALDAQACGLPVIMQSDTTNRERLAKGGLCYEKGNLQDLAAKVLRLAASPGERATLGKGGEAYVRSKYDYRKIVRQMEADLGLHKEPKL